ncbi:unnamed protein product [Porites lobata]|uniref:Uncharacterized protein n=1 Tax=Porites lobata TaxID=104759 RepID=A0ABN8Q7F0_9CNID|nr:unnamed protein product [Porites lobata]
MDPIVKKLLEGKPEDEKYQAIAFSFACLLTGPRANQSRDAPFNSEEHVAKKDADQEPKFSFEEVNDDEEDSSGTV